MPILKQHVLLQLPIVCRHAVRHKSNGAAIKSVNYANKVLYGGVTGKTATTTPPKKGDDDDTVVVPPEAPAKNDLSSEMYWLLQHKAIATKSPPAKRSAKRRSTVSVCAPDEELLQIVKPRKRAAKKTDKTPTSGTTIPSSLSRFGDTLCKPPVKGLAALVPPAKHLKQRSSHSDGLEHMLRVPPFHAHDGASGFDDVALNEEFIGCEQRLQMHEMPSVGKVLQATMPEASRRALMNWKQLKIAELGMEGFLALQKCE